MWLNVAIKKCDDEIVIKESFKGKLKKIKT